MEEPVAKRKRTTLTKQRRDELVRKVWTLSSATTEELMTEIARRNTGVLCVTCSVDDTGADLWRSWTRGSALLLGTLAVAADSTVKNEIAAIVAAAREQR